MSHSMILDLRSTKTLNEFPNSSINLKVIIRLKQTLWISHLHVHTTTTAGLETYSLFTHTAKPAFIIRFKAIHEICFSYVMLHLDWTDWTLILVLLHL